MSKNVKRAPGREASRRERREEQRRRELARIAAQRRRTTLTWLAIGAVVLVVGFLLIKSIVQANTASTNPNYPAVDKIQCQSMEQFGYHIHAHLAIYIDGQPVTVPANTGIATNGSCYYWLHTHDTSGIIHIESPTQTLYTLGNFLHIWSQRFPELQYPAQLDSSGGWQVYVDGKAYSGDFHAIKLKAHTIITLAYNSPKVTAATDSVVNWDGQ